MGMRILSWILSIIAMISSLGVRCIRVTAPEDTNEFTPVIRFIASSDSHVNQLFDENSRRIQKMLRLGYTVADADDAYNRLDALLIAGDLTDDGKKYQFDALQVALKSALKANTAFLGVVAKSHDGFTMDRAQTHAYYTALTGNSPDFHTVINGFHFIGLSASDNDDVHYDDGQIEWLREQLQDATAEDPAKPVFVMHHEHVRGTVYGSADADGWGVSYFTDVLRDFPQVVDFSGHSHYPLNDPRSIWQGEFTAVGTGALYYAEFTVDGVNTIHPDGNRDVATCWIVEVDANNRVRLLGVDILAQKVLVEYILDNPADLANRPYTPEKRAAASTPPIFDEAAEIKAKLKRETCTVTVPAAKSTDGMEIVLYRAAAFAADGSEIANTWTIPKYYVAQDEPVVTLQLSLKQTGTYEIRVVAETAYGVQSAPLTTTVTMP